MDFLGAAINLMNTVYGQCAHIRNENSPFAKAKGEFVIHNYDLGLLTSWSFGKLRPILHLLEPGDFPCVPVLVL